MMQKKVTGLDNLLWDTYKTYIHYSYLSNLGQEHMEIPSTLNIAKMYPDLVKKMNDNKVSILVRQGENSQEEWFDILMSWFCAGWRGETFSFSNRQGNW